MTDTNVTQLIINKLTKAQYDALQDKSETELYLVPDEIDDTPTSGSENPVTSDGIKTALDTKQDTLVSGTNVKSINNQSVLGNGNLDVKDVFIATISQTSINDLDEAYNNGKILFVVYKNTNVPTENALLICQSKDVTSENGWQFKFSGVDVIGRNIGITCTTNDNGNTWLWNRSIRYQKVDFIGSTSTNTQIPSAKAVYDFVQGQIGNINTILETI